MRLDVDNITAGYGTTPIVRDFSVTLVPGQILCLLGPNGVGKTTLFKSMLGLLPLLHGTIRIDGHNTHNLTRTELARSIGYVPQKASNPFAFTALDVVIMGRTAHLGMFGSPSRADVSSARESLVRLGVERLAEAPFGQLSGGEAQMVLIARALAQQPGIIMLDEPTAALDFGNQARVLDQIMRLAEDGMGVVMTTHDPDQVFLCDADVVLLRDGAVFEAGHGAAVLTAENLSATYGIPVSVTTIAGPDGPITSCQPRIERDRDATP